MQVKTSPFLAKGVVECASRRPSHLFDEITAPSISDALSANRYLTLERVKQKLFTIYPLNCSLHPNTFKVTLEQVDDITYEIFFFKIRPSRVELKGD
jgi:hypothetical protein